MAIRFGSEGPSVDSGHDRVSFARTSRSLPGVDRTVGRDRVRGELLEDLQADDAGCGAFAQLGRLARHADEGATGLFARDRLGGPMRIVGRFEQVVRFDTVLMHGSAAGGGVATPSRPVCLRLTF